jgi:dTDP-glucose 4,6-dehydratase
MDPTFPFRRAVVTGGAGFIGSHVCDALVAAGVRVVCVDNLLTGTTENVGHLIGRSGFQMLVGDVVDPLPIDGEVDLVLHLASPASPRDYQRYPIETLATGGTGTLNMLSFARAKRARLVLASTSEVYGDPLQHPQTEQYWGNVNPIGPRSVYDEAKRFAEAATAAYRREHGVDTAIVRFFNTYGPRMRVDDGRVVPSFIHSALAGRPLHVTGDGMQTRSLCYVDDTVRGLLAMAASDREGPVNLGGTEELTILDVARLILALCDSDSDILFIDRPADDPRLRWPDITRARTQLDWHPRIPVREGLSATIEWYRSRQAAPGARAFGAAPPGAAAA